MTLLTRRSLLGGIGAVLAAPYIVRAASLMPVKAITDYKFESWWTPLPQIFPSVWAPDGTIYLMSNKGLMTFPPACPDYMIASPKTIDLLFGKR